MDFFGYYIPINALAGIAGGLGLIALTSLFMFFEDLKRIKDNELRWLIAEQATADHAALIAEQSDFVSKKSALSVDLFGNPTKGL